MDPSGELEPHSLHGACPVKQGVKWAANKWVSRLRRKSGGTRWICWGSISALTNSFGLFCCSRSFQVWNKPVEFGPGTNQPKYKHTTTKNYKQPPDPNQTKKK